VRDASGRLEINLVYNLVRQCFAAKPHQPHRVGRKPGAPGQEDFVELAFISPEVAARYCEELERLSLETGWRLVSSSVPNQNAVLQAAREVLEGIAVRKGPSIRPAEGKVSVRIDGVLDAARCDELRRRFRERTGYELEIEGWARSAGGG
jgi:hypothetical protein